MKKHKQGIKKLIISIFLTGILVCLSAPLYSNGNAFKSIIESRHTNKTARIDIINRGGKDNAVKILSNTLYGEPQWCKNDKGSCSVITEKIAYKWQDYSIKFQVIGNGEVTISLKGPDKKDESNVRYPVIVDYQNFIVNNEQVFKETARLWYDNPYNYSFQAKNGEVVEIKIGIRKHHFKYKLWKKLVHFRSNMLLSVLILSFLFSYKLVQYIAKFKILENNSRIDIVFVIVFIVLLFYPMSKISTADKSMQENRMLAKSPEVFVNGSFHQQFTQQFEQWFNDRFRGRDNLVSAHSFLRELQSNKENDKVLVGKDGWLFYKLDNGYNNFANRSVLSEEKMKKGLEYLIAIDEWCKKNKKEFYYIIAPDKNKIYGENYRIVKKSKPDSYGIGYQFINYIHKHSNVKAVYLRDELMTHKDEGLLYYKNDTHWNFLGAYYGYRKLMELMGRKPLNISFEKTDNHEPGDLTNMYKQVEAPVLYEKPNLKKWIQCSGVDRNPRKCTNLDNEINIFVLRDSFTQALMPYLSSTFKNSHFFWRYNITKEDLEFVRKNSDIIILENVERFIPWICNQKFPKD